MSILLFSATIAAAPLVDAQSLITVTAARVPETASPAQSLTVFDATRIESLNLPQLSDLIRLMPGVSVGVSGPVGSLTSVRIRGAEANHTLTFVDGIELNDPAAGNATRFETLSADSVSRLELLRGAQSALWGAEALGGVIAITTPDPVDGLRGSAQSEYGSHDTRRASAGLSAGTDKGGVALNAAWLKTDGIDALGQGGERDGFENLTLNAKAIARPADGELGLTARYTRSDVAFDSGFPRRQSSHTTHINGKAVRGWVTYGTDHDAPWTLTLNGTVLDSTSRNRRDATPLDDNNGLRVRMGGQLTHRFAIGRFDQRLTVAVENTFDRFVVRDISGLGTNDQRRTRENLAFVGEWRARLDETLDVGAAIRHDNSNRFASETTLKADAALQLGGGFNVHGGYGEAFAQPTMTELYYSSPDRFVGNPNLKPERGWNVETGFGWSNNVVTFDLTGFVGRLTDEIGFTTPDYLSTRNLSGKSRRKGFEATAEARPLDWLRLSASYSYLDAKQQDDAGTPSVREIRRPKHSAAFSADARFDRFSAGLGLSYTGRRTDTDFDITPAADIRLKSYLLASLNLAYKLTDAVEVYVRGANLANERYQDVLRYATERRTVYGGVRVRFGQ